MPAQILGFNAVPTAGDFVMVVSDEREARQKAEQRTARLRMEQQARSRGGAQFAGRVLPSREGGPGQGAALVIKGDVGGSVEALEEALQNISHAEVKVHVIFAGVGGINESDVMLAAASKAVVIGFNVRPSAAAKALAEQEQVDVRTYRVIYKAIEDVEAALVGMLEPEYVEEELGMRGGAAGIPCFSDRPDRRMLRPDRQDHPFRQGSRRARRQHRPRRHHRVAATIRGRRPRGFGRVRMRSPS